MKRRMMGCPVVVLATVILTMLMLMATPVKAQDAGHPLKRGMSIDFTGGYAYTKFRASGFPNMNGLIGSVGVNVLPWLEVQADASAQYGSVSGAKATIYGNHFGPRVFYHPRDWPFRVFGEFLVGGSRLDLTLTRQGAQKFSENGFSFKAGGGVDLALSRHWSVRVIDADFYRTPFLQSHQNNVWLSSAVVFTFGNRRIPD